MKHGFTRYTGAGNTFVVLNGFEDPLGLTAEQMTSFVMQTCDYKTGVGSDGLILINQSERAPFRMDFYNPDGSTGMLCGNGARCAVMAAKDFHLIGGTATTFEVLDAINRAELLNSGVVRVHFQDPVVIEIEREIGIDGEAVRTHYVDVGSQHSVTFVSDLPGKNDIETMDIATIGEALRWHSAFQPLGANANFIEVREDGDEKYLRIRTFERGVEGETQACGTGCMSSAIVAYLTGAIRTTPIRLLTQSGEYVTVNFVAEDEIIRDLTLEGTAIKGEEGLLTFDEANLSLDIAFV